MWVSIPFEFFDATTTGQVLASVGCKRGNREKIQMGETEGECER